MTDAPHRLHAGGLNVAEIEALEGRVALRISSALTESTLHVSHDIGERLRFAREQALHHARTRVRVANQRQHTASEVSLYRDGSLTLTSPPGFWFGLNRWLSGVVPALALALGLLVIDAWQTQEQVSDIANVDAMLLSDDLPPEAYGDPGFTEFASTFSSPEPSIKTPGE